MKLGKDISKIPEKKERDIASFQNKLDWLLRSDLLLTMKTNELINLYNGIKSRSNLTPEVKKIILGKIQRVLDKREE